MKHLADIFNGAVALALLFAWVAGVVLAKGFWSTIFAVVIGPFWAWYLVVERCLQAWGWA